MKLELVEASSTIQKLKEKEEQLHHRITILESNEASAIQKISYLECKINSIMSYNKILLDKVILEANSNEDQLQIDPYPTYMRIFEMEEQLDPVCNISIGSIIYQNNY